MRATYVGYMPGQLDLEIYQGNVFNLAIQLTDDNDAPIDITGLTWVAQIRRLPATAAILLTFTLAANTSTSTLTLSLTAAQTAAFPLDPRSSWDLLETTTNRTWLRGSVTSTASITRV